MSDSDDSSQWTDDEEEEDDWKVSVKTKMEEEIARRVADALPETPPLERQRKREAARRAQEYDPNDLNAHLDFSEEFYLKKEQEAIAQIKGRLIGIDMWGRSKQADPVEPEEVDELEDSAQRKEVTRQYQFYEPHEKHPGTLQHYGVVANTTLTSFDPNSIVPLLPHPRLENIIPTDPEPLYSAIKFVIGSRTYENQVTPYTHKLRGSGIVYDSQKSPKHQKIEQPSNPLLAPNLVLESRFESGNLRQARRVGQFEYELVLKTDMFTKRHTQWYYFRIQNMAPGIIYKFRIVNLLKKDSLYNYGMRPLFYSEQSVIKKRQGWIRHGHHISYGRNVQHLLNPLLNREMVYYELEWQMEFPYSEDTCYLAHCYPLSHTDLKNDLLSLHSNNKYKSFLKQEVLCKSIAGHECYLLTITNFEKTHCNKKCVVVSARVHPGESNSSWMMKGLYEFLISDNPEAKELRDRFVFKIIPMLNPDGVIVGNYRCSLQARDLNRNYRWPKQDRFPTIWSVKKLVESLQQESGVFVYCDFHGHSRKANVFMYGNSLTDPNDPEGNGGSIKDFLSERMLPFMISQLDPEMFNFQGSRFAIRKCKESTGRVVMFRQHNIVNSFTMEATFSGTKVDQSGARHYNQQDFMDAGSLFARGVLQYSKVIENKEKESQAFLDLAKDVTQQLLNNSIKRKLISTTRNFSEGADAEEQNKESTEDNNSSDSPQEQSSSPGRRTGRNRRSRKAVSGSNRVSQQDDSGISISQAKAAMEQLQLISSSTENSVQECFNLLENLSIAKNFTPQSEESSDSDSESEPEMIDEKVKKKKKNKKNKKKDSRKPGKTISSISDEYVQRNFKPAAAKAVNPNAVQPPTPANPKLIGYSSAPARQPAHEDNRQITKLKILPAIGDQEDEPTSSTSVKGMEGKSRSAHIWSASLDSSDKLSSGWANPYQHRSNGGIPCYSEERSLERAAKKMAELQKKVEEKARKQHKYIPYNNPGDHAPEIDLDLQELNALKLQKKHVQDSFNKSIRLLTQSCIPDLAYYTGKLDNGNLPSFESEFGDVSTLQRRKKKSLTPINDTYGMSRESTRETWRWYPHESTHGRERKIPENNQSTQGAQPKGVPQSILMGTKKQTGGKPVFPPARLGPVSRAPQASRLKNALRVNPMHYQHGFE